ncbi:hypothetical protein EVAR_21605_1 [Eumeta japonica]|uniref:Uncharacterized protein n=1 Tax=Eumeta variegata TaxID=151549 RepID=A0A4C1UYS7_EUMVA|nr:hypothetical protein EVAR_21605_1 [Eumeta japonica]
MGAAAKNPRPHVVARWIAAPIISEFHGACSSFYIQGQTLRLHQYDTDSMVLIYGELAPTHVYEILRAQLVGRCHLQLRTIENGFVIENGIGIGNEIRIENESGVDSKSGPEVAWEMRVRPKSQTTVKPKEMKTELQLKLGSGLEKKLESGTKMAYLDKGNKELSEARLALKEKLCRGVLRTAAALCAGESHLRGLLLYHLHAALAERARRHPETYEELKSEIESTIEQAYNILEGDMSAPPDLGLRLQYLGPGCDKPPIERFFILDNK